MTANLPNDSYQPGISQITEAVFSTMLELSICAIDGAQHDRRYELTAAVYYAEQAGIVLVDGEQLAAWAADTRRAPWAR